MALLLPAVEARRTQISLPTHTTPHPLGDMLRSVPKCRAWTPLDGKCRLDLDDLRGAHPDLRKALEHYVLSGHEFLRAGHMRNPYEKGKEVLIEAAWHSGIKRRVEFEFESAPLLQLLKM